MPFSTERLVLRDITADDVEAIHAYAGDPEVCRYMVWGPNTLEDTRAFVKEELEVLAAAEGKVYNKLVVDASGLVIGGTEIRVLSAEHRRGEFGYVYRRDQWAQGYATEVARAMVAFGFGELGLERISATCDPRNHASARVLEKAGLRLEGRMRHHVLVRGQWRDSLLYAVLSGD
jgi:ribosomal-protein-alanine N-acetyltransferase